MNPPTPQRRAAARRAALLGLTCLQALLAPSAGAADALEGRWEGQAAIPGAAMAIVLDLAEQDGRLAGWLTLPGRGIKGMLLPGVQREGAELKVDLTPAFNMMGPPKPTPRLVLTMPAGRTAATQAAPATLAGRFEQGGHQAPVALVRAGDAQPEPMQRNSALTPALVGTWKGQYELAGYPRQVTLVMSADAAEAVIVGRRTTRVPMDVIRLGTHHLLLANREMQLAIEGRVAPGEFDATFTQGPYEAPLMLRKEGAR